MSSVKKHFKLIIFLFIILGFILLFNNHTIRYRFSLWLSKQTIPFDLIAKPQNEKPKKLELLQVNKNKTDVITNINQQKLSYFQLIDDLNAKYKNNYSFLNDKRSEDHLKSVISKEHHDFIDNYSISAFGKEGSKDFFILNVNKKDDTPIITTYRFKTFVNNNNNKQIEQSIYLDTITNDYPPTPLYKNITIDHLGFDVANSVLNKMQNLILNAYQPNTKFEAGKSIVSELKLDSQSDSKIQEYAELAKGNFKNSGITKILITDVPYEIKYTVSYATIKKIKNFTLIYDRNSNSITGFH